MQAFAFESSVDKFLHTDTENVLVTWNEKESKNLIKVKITIKRVKE